MKRRVVKVGGSLFSLDRMGDKLVHWLEANNDMQNILVVGGGCVADLVRQNSDRLSDEASHMLACGAMRMTANLVSHVIGQKFPCSKIDELQSLALQNFVFDSHDWILAQTDVPRNWDFTSDSIAARLATVLKVDELVLLKSRMGELDEPGFVDACFATESRSLKSVRVCTLFE